jgi:hypothetical protein
MSSQFPVYIQNKKYKKEIREKEIFEQESNNP